MATNFDILSSDLDNLEKSITKSFCRNNEEFELVSKKGIFTYDYLGSRNKLEDQLMKFIIILEIVMLKNPIMYMRRKFVVYLKLEICTSYLKISRITLDLLK